MGIQRTRRFLNRYADALVGGDFRRPGEIGTFDRNLIRSGTGAVRMSRINRRGPDVCKGDGNGGGCGGGRKRHHRRHHRGKDGFRMGAVSGHFSNMGLVAVAAVAVGGYLLLKK